MNQKLSSLMEKIRKIDQWILDMLYPPRCPICDGVVLPEEGICDLCRKKVRYVTEPACMQCGQPLENPRQEFCPDCMKKKHGFVQGKALWVYEEGVKASVYRFKYQNKREYGKVYASEIALRYGAWIKRQGIEAIVPIPLYRRKQKRRGYNQAEILAKELGRALGIPVCTDLLIRVRDTKPQKTLNDAERKNNLKNAFKTAQNIVQLRCILVVDDIYTTGSTLDSAAAVLKEAGAARIYACCISIGQNG